MAQGLALQVQQFLVGMAFPATKEDIASYMAAQGADEEVLEKIEDLPDDKDFSTPDEVGDHVDSAEEQERSSREDIP